MKINICKIEMISQNNKFRENILTKIPKLYIYLNFPMYCFKKLKEIL